MPVLPLVGSSSRRPGRSSPEASAPSIIAFATRSLIEPVGFWPSSFAYRRTDGFGDSRGSSTRGVLPTRSSRLDGGASRLATGHRGQQDDLRALADRGIEALAGADVLAADVRVHEGREVAVLVDLRLQAGEAAGQVVQHLAERRARGLDLALAVRLG